MCLLYVVPTYSRRYVPRFQTCVCVCSVALTVATTTVSENMPTLLYVLLYSYCCGTIEGG
jgi:hypothetical protein